MLHRTGKYASRSICGTVWLDSAPHGAGRKMTRNQARKQIPLSEYESAMAGIFSTSVCTETLDESPQAYKSAEEILSLITPAVDVISFVRPKHYCPV